MPSVTSTDTNNDCMFIPGYHSDGYEGSPATTPKRHVESESYSSTSIHHFHPLTLPAMYPPSDLFQSGWGSESLRSSVRSFSISSPPSSPGPTPKSAVGSVSPTPTLLTEELMIVGNDAVSTYDTLRTKHFEASPELPPQNPFFSDSFTREALENYYAAAVDVKNILQLRQSIVKADIGDALEHLLPKMGLYDQDRAILEAVIDELQLVKEACFGKNFDINFFGLEFHRCIFPQYPLSVMEERSMLFSTLRYSLGQKDDAQQAAHRFMEDPSALREHRLPHFGTSQR